MRKGYGRLEPPDFEHVEKYPLKKLRKIERPKVTPVVLGINWYSSFNTPVKRSDGTYWVTSASGRIEGGHAICIKPDILTDYAAWWDFYNQRRTGQCVGFSGSRMMSLLNRARYDAPWLYFAAQENAGQIRDPNSGTYVRSAGEVLRELGHKTPRWDLPRLPQGISAYRWATTVNEIIEIIGSPKQVERGAFNLVNSWGRSYPHVVRFSFEVIEKMLQENGECMVPTDR